MRILEQPIQPDRSGPWRDFTGDHWDWLQIRRRCAREALRMLRRHHDAEEVVQEALARAWRGRSSCRTPDAALPWCLQITRNEARRAIGRRALSASEPIDPSIDLEDPRAGGEPDRAVQRLDLASALKQLSATDRLLISLRYEHDWSHPEIAARLGIPETTARVHLHRARKRLRALLEEHS